MPPEFGMKSHSTYPAMCGIKREAGKEKLNNNNNNKKNSINFPG